MIHRLGVVGLGKMGGNLARLLRDKGWEVVGFNRTTEVAQQLAAETGLEVATSFQVMITNLPAPAVIWLMLPAGEATEQALFGEHGLARLLQPGAIIIDGGNSFYKDSIRRSELLAQQGIRFMDVGVSGGPGGARTGACLMIGGDQATFTQVEELFEAVSLPNGYQFFEGPGAGHFVKMIHNGIEYGMMQAIAEGFDILEASPYHFDLMRVAEIYNHGSVIESRLINWLGQAFVTHGTNLAGATSTVAHTGEGAWTVQTATELGVPAPIIAGSLEIRQQSASNPRFAGKILSAIREQFGGHSIK